MNVSVMPEPIDDADVTLITNYVNTVDIEEAMAYISDNDCFAEEAWLSFAAGKLAENWMIQVMTAYAHAKGELTSLELTLPEVQDEN